jgi:hypothetical protein
MVASIENEGIEEFEKNFLETKTTTIPFKYATENWLPQDLNIETEKLSLFRFGFN